MSVTCGAVHDDAMELGATEHVASEIPACGGRAGIITYDLARRFSIVAMEAANGVTVYHAPSTPRWIIHNVAAMARQDVSIIEAPAGRVVELIDRAYVSAHEAVGDVEAYARAREDAEPTFRDDSGLGEAAERDLLSTDGKGVVVSLVDRILFDAVRRRASDVHVQPLADRTLVRIRVDGVLHDIRECEPRIAEQIVARLKVIGRMDVAEHRVPQDGRASVTIGRAARPWDQERAIDLRISTLPTSHGERVVVRLLDKDGTQLAAGPRALGMPGSVETGYLDAASRSSGVILVTGPTGSGKTTTLYTTLQWIAVRGDERGRRLGLNVMTIEEPIEYELSRPGVAISQAQVNRMKGVTFASGLRHILRQDPDIIMVGEIRDEETARIAIQASLTGHVVLSTVHTNDAVGTVSRMLDLGIEPYLLASSLSGVLAQRLVRTLHTACAGVGCDLCLGSGFLGRCGIFEWLAVADAVRDAISRRAAPVDLRRIAREAGLGSMAEHGEDLVRRGVTTLVEVRQVTMGV